MCPEIPIPIPGQPSGPPRTGPGKDDRPIQWIRVTLFVSLLFVFLVFIVRFVFVRAGFTAVEPCRDSPGQITIWATSGFGPLTFTWSSTVPGWTPSVPLDGPQTGLDRGTYVVVITNSLGLSKTLKIELGGLEDAGLAATPPSGFFTADGAISVDVTPAGEACNFSWSDSVFTQNRAGLNPGVYTVTVTDATNPPCGLVKSSKLSPAYAVPCADWQSRNAQVLSLREWCRRVTFTGTFAHRSRVQMLISPTPYGPLSLVGCTGAAFLRYSVPLALLEYLERHTGGIPVNPEWSYAGPVQNPAATSLPLNHLAAELLVLKLNIRNVASSASVRMEDAVYLGNPYYGLTVGRLMRLAELALQCKEDSGGRPLGEDDLGELRSALERINDGGYYLACPMCPPVFFEQTGDLPGCGIQTVMNDVSGDGQRCVGSCAADDSLVATDGEGSCAHCAQAFGFIRPCASERFFPLAQLATPGFPPGNGGLGLMGLGYLPADTHAESVADGISPDGAVVVGYASTHGGGCGVTRAVAFLGDVPIELTAPPGNLSRAHDVTDAAVVVAPASDGPFGHGRRIAVGYITTGTNHPFRSEGARAVWWDAAGVPHDLPMPPGLPNGAAILSSDAKVVSDDGSVIAGDLYYDVGDYYTSNSYACVWNGTSAGYAAPIILEDVPGGDADARVTRVSGDGRTIVGFGWEAGGERAVRWNRSGSSWTTAPQVLAMIAGAERSFAYGVNHDGSVVVGSCTTSDYTTQSAARWSAGSVQNIVDLLSATTPPVTIPAGWQLNAYAVSADGKTIVGLGYDGDFVQHGWIARMP